MAGLYEIMKGKTYSLAATIGGKSNADAKDAGFKDVFDYIMSDSNHPRQLVFIASLPDVLPEGHRKILLDEMAREYAGVDGWMQYVDQEADR